MEKLKQLLKQQGKIWLHGLMVVVPAIVTIWVIILAIDTLDGAVRTILEFVMSFFGGTEDGTAALLAGPGFGLAITFLMIYLVGVAANVWFLRDPMKRVEKVIDHVPVIKSIYSSIRDLTQFLGNSEPETRGRPCVVTTADGTVRMLGLLTQKKPQRFMPQEEEERVGVYFPMSYQIGGYTVYVPADRVEVIEGMTVEELFKLCMMAGLSSKEVPGEPGEEEPSQVPDERSAGDTEGTWLR